MRRFLLFRGYVFYPSGGMDDFIGDYISIEDAIQANETEMLKDWEYVKHGYDDKKEYLDYQKEYTWGHIYDTELRQEVWVQS